MELLINVILPVMLYVVAIILLIILIVVGIKLIKVLDRVDAIAENVEEKIDTFNGALRILKTASDGVANIGESIVCGVSNIVSKFIKNKNENYEEEDYE